jgi:hypothetical protein
VASNPSFENDFEDCARLLPGAVAGKLLADPTPFALDGFAEVLRWIEIIDSHDYWVVRWTAVLDRRDMDYGIGGHRSLDVRVRLGAAPTAFGAPDRTTFFERLAARQGLSLGQAREVARVASVSEEALRRCVQAEDISAPPLERGAVARRNPGRA